MTTAATHPTTDTPRIVVPFVGPQPCHVLLVGEAPGREEAAQLRPFVGRSGQEQEWYLSRHGLTARSWRVGNVCCEYTEGNPDPTTEQIREWTPNLEREIAATRPSLIVAVGRHAVRWFLGAKADMQTTHGLPHRGGAFDVRLADRSHGAIVIPVIHPATGFYSGDAKALIDWDYGQVAHTLKKIQRGQTVTVREDEFVGRELYSDIQGELFSWAEGYVGALDVIAVDTEGVVGAPWSIQVSGEAGTAAVMRCAADGFDRGVRALQAAADRGATIVLHNAMWDIPVLRAMGVELRNARVWDTMYAAYLLRLEPQGLKPLAWRWCGMHMDAYDSVVAGASHLRQLEYLCDVAADAEWPKPEQRVVRKNDGTSRLYRPKPLAGRALTIIQDYITESGYDPDREMIAVGEGGMTDTPPPDIDLHARWRAILPDVRRPAEERFGAFPQSTLDDAPRDAAIRYSARDADATFRLYQRLAPELARRGLTRTMAAGMSVLPIFEEIQATGMVASRSKFESLLADVDADMDRLQSTISWRYFDKRPFNPMSSQHVATLMRRRGLTGEKRTASGKVSTAKKSIEHLRYTDEAIAAVIDWRENAKIRDAFCKPVIERAEIEPSLPGHPDLFPVRCKIKTTRVATRRLAASDPNLLQIPTRHELGKRVRDCYVAPPGQVYGSWDLSMIEIRYLAHESEDPLLCRLLNEGRDFHSETAAAIFNIPLDQVDKMKHRYPAKRCSFGIAYGVTGAGLYDQFRMMEGAEEGEWTVDKCDRLIEDWLRVYKGAADYFRWCATEAAKTGYVRDHWGMYRFIPGIWSRESGVRAEAERIAVNHRIQGGAQGMLQNSMAWLRPRIRELQDAGLNVHWTLQIHDEILLRFDVELWEHLNEIVTEALVRHSGIRLRVPVESSGAYGETWGTAKE